MKGICIMAQNEIVGSKVNEIVANRKAEVVLKRAVILALPGEVKVVKSKAKNKKEVKVKVKVKAKRGPGRPRVYNGTHRRIIAAALKHYGLTGGMAYLAKERGLKISLTLANAVAKAEKIKFTRGRPKAA